MALAMLAGCAEDPSVEPDARGAFADLFLEDDIRVCGGQLAAYDAFLERAFELYAGTSPGRYRVAVHVVGDPGDAPCGSNVACTVGGEVWLTQELGQYHELVHAMQGALDGRSAPSLEEGTAQALGPPWPGVYPPDLLAAAAPVQLFARTPETLDYDLAAAFTRFLIERHGAPAFRAFFRAMGGKTDAIETAYRNGFADAFGEDLDVAWSMFQGGARCAYQLSYCVDATPSRQIPFEMEPFDCDSPSALGFVDDRALPAMGVRESRILRFSHDVAGPLTLELAGVHVYLGKCGDCSEQIPYLDGVGLPAPGFPPVSTEIDLDAGDYVMIVRALDGGEPFVRVSQPG